MKKDKTFLYKTNNNIIMSTPSTIPESTWREWKRKRRNATIGYIIYGTVTGMDYSIIFSTLYFYLKDMIKSSNVKFYYGFIICVYCISSSLFGMIAGRFVDKTRRVVRYMNIITIIQIVGCLVYIIPYSEAYPVVARFLIGSGESFSDVCSGEVIRIYNERKGTRALYYISSAYTIGFIIAPAINLLYKNIDFHVFSIHVTYLNFGGIFMAILLTLTLIVNNTLVHDCSAIIDYKEYLKFKTRTMRSFTNEVSVDDLEAAVGTTNSNEIEKAKNEDLSVSAKNNKEEEVTEMNGGVRKQKVIIISEAETKVIEDEIATTTTTTTDINDNENSSGDATPPPEPASEIISTIPVSEADSSEYNSENESNGTNLSDLNPISSFRLKRNDKCLTEFAKSAPIPLRTILRGLFSNPDSLIIIMTGVILTYCLFATDVILPMIIHDVFNWSVNVVMFVYLAYGILSLIVLLIMSKLCISGRKIYIVTIICIVSVILQFAVTATINFTRRDTTTDAILLSLLLIFSVFGWCLIDVLLRSLMSKMVPSSIQSFTEVFRAITARASVVVASLTGPFLVPYLHYWGLVSIICLTFVLFCFIMRRKHFISIKEIHDFQQQVLESDSHSRARKQSKIYA